MTRILALDTSTEACSVALVSEGVLLDDFRLIPRKHADTVLTMVSDLLLSAKLRISDLDAIAVSCGPGSFTGIRIAVSVAQGLSFASDTPLIPVSTLTALAWQAFEKYGATRIINCLDARIEEVYWSAVSVDDTGVLQVSGEHLNRPEEMSVPEGQDWFGVGNGWAFRESMQPGLRKCVTGFDDQMMPRARDILALGVLACQQGKTYRSHEVLPTYLRDKVANKPQKVVFP